MDAILKVKMLEVSKIKEAIIVAAFTLAAVYTPVMIHFFGGVNAGQKFLPMPFFVLLAGILLGWRAGLVTAIAAPLISFLLSGMPAINILPFIILQLAVLGLVSGILRKKMDVFFSLCGAIFAGWLAIGISLFLFSRIDALNYVITGLKNGLIGIVLALVLISTAVIIINKYLSREKGI